MSENLHPLMKMKFRKGLKSNIKSILEKSRMVISKPKDLVTRENERLPEKADAEHGYTRP